jgi:hypothetical protein
MRVSELGLLIRSSTSSTKASLSFHKADGICDISFGKVEVSPTFYQWLEARRLQDICDVLVSAGYDDVTLMIEQMSSPIPINE